MARTFIRQDTQIRNSDLYDDTLVAGITLETANVNIEDDLNGLRSQVKRAIWADAVGDWYSDIQTTNGKKRAITALNFDLDDVEEHKFLFRSLLVGLTDIAVPAAQNWKILSVAGSEAPSEVSATALTVDGAVTAHSALSGAGFNVHETITIAGPNAISPKNIVLVVDATDGEPIQSSGRDVFALLQDESTGVDGTVFDDTVSGHRAKLSFVRLNAGRTALEACPVADIAGKSVNYEYIRRLHYDVLPEYAFLTSGFIDNPGAATAVTLDNAIDNQVGPATQVQNIEVRITDTFSWAFEDSTGAAKLLEVKPTAGGDEIHFTVDTFDVNNALDADFLNGAKFDTGGTEIDIGVTAGLIGTTGAADLRILGAGEFYLDDGNQAGSTWAQTNGIKLSDTTAEWDAYEAAFGGEVSLLYGIAQSKRRSKVYANCTSTTTANTDVGGVGGGTNLDAQLPDQSIGSFLLDYDVFLNGKLLRPGANAAANNDYYPGTSTLNGQLKFEFTVKINDVLCVIPYAR